MAKWYVTIEEKLTYNLEVEAETSEEAEDKAFMDERFCTSKFDDNDVHVASVDRAWEAVGEEKYRIGSNGNDTYVERVSDGVTVAAFVDHDDAVAYVAQKGGEQV